MQKKSLISKYTTEHKHQGFSHENHVSTCTYKTCKNLNRSYIDISYSENGLNVGLGKLPDEINVES